MTSTAPARVARHRPALPHQVPGAPAVSLQEVTMTYKGRTEASVDHVSLAIPAGGIFGLLGPNGAGKSTTISLVTGLAVPSAGTVEVFGRPPGRAKADIGVVDQDTALHKPLSVEYNLRFAARLRGYWGRECRDRVAAGLRLARLEDFAGVRAGTLSGGMARRLAIACALIHDPRLIILDEPTAGVDPGERAMLWDHIRALADAGRTILLTTHLLDEAQALCRQVVIMRAGRIAAGPETPGELRRAYGSQTVTVRTIAGPTALNAALTEIRAINGVSRAAAATASGGGHEVTVCFRQGGPAPRGEAGPAQSARRQHLPAAPRRGLRVFPWRGQGRRAKPAATGPGDSIAGQVVTALTGNGAGIADVTTRDAGLDEVFLRLTGFDEGRP